ncbi:unnamed protein product [Bursaphelenchus xylophilus]|uniref:(pine wood nematode) hypothetical protein n=1 Tax=Bursaphelenchus xylophilus TaxID=6326 RepID=A0A1I7S0D8_BURXY|nr:unnamed protein product [Bursaphelenchus xylophilus]CAG9132221.1 unnamed protein product [Bursaphelenchus xylophilus]
MKFVGVVVLATLIALTFAAPDKKCGPNSVFSKCASACPTTCTEVVNNATDKICIAMCKPDCVCNEGYTLHNGECYATATCATLVKKQ